MQRPERKIAEGQPQPDRAPAKPFAGRSALISGLIDHQKAYLDSPPSIQYTDKETLQIMASALVLETAMELSRSRQAVKEYVDELVRQSTLISLERKARSDAEKAPKTATATPAAKPASRKELLEAALSHFGIDAEIIGEKCIDAKSMFTVRFNGDTTKVLIYESMLASDDPVAQALKILGVLDITGTGAKKALEERAAQRRSTRPPPTPLGLSDGELDSRKVTFDGVLEKPGKMDWLFTYTAEGLETSFTIGSEATGWELMDLIEARLEGIHEQYGKPYPACVIEAISDNRTCKPYLFGLPEDIRGIAQTLDVLAAGILGDIGHLVPPEYLEAYRAMKKHEPPRQVYLDSHGKDELIAALDGLEHPVYTIARSTYGREELAMTQRLREEMVSLFRIAPMVNIDICDRALQNMAGAYHLLADATVVQDNVAIDPRKDYFRVAFTVRMAIEKAISNKEIVCE